MAEAKLHGEIADDRGTRRGFFESGVTRARVTDLFPLPRGRDVFVNCFRYGRASGTRALAPRLDLRQFASTLPFFYPQPTLRPYSSTRTGISVDNLHPLRRPSTPNGHGEGERHLHFVEFKGKPIASLERDKIGGNGTRGSRSWKNSLDIRSILTTNGSDNKWDPDLHRGDRCPACFSRSPCLPNAGNAYKSATEWRHVRRGCTITLTLATWKFGPKVFLDFYIWALFRGIGRIVRFHVLNLPRRIQRSWRTTSINRKTRILRTGESKHRNYLSLWKI